MILFDTQQSRYSGDLRMASTDSSGTVAIRLTRFFMRFAGFWIWNDQRGKILTDLAMIYSIAAILFSWLVTGADLWHSRDSFNEFAYAACNLITTVIILVKLTLFSLQREAFLNLIRFCYENFWKRDYDGFGRTVVERCDLRCTYFVCTFTFFAQSTAFIYTIQPIIQSIGRNETDRMLPFTLWVDLPVTTTPYYEILFSIETLSTFYSGICFFCFDNFLCIMNVHVTGQFQILQKRFELVCDTDAYDFSYPGRTTSSMNDGENFNTNSHIYPDQYNKFKSCVQNHQVLIKFTKMIEDVYTFAILSQVLISSLLICLVSYQAVLAVGSLTRRMIFIVHSSGTFTQIFMITLTCDDLIQESQAVADAAFRAQWSCKLSTPQGRRICKDLIIVMIRARRPCCLTAGGFFPVSLETFTTILSTSMSYLTLLRQAE